MDLLKSNKRFQEMYKYITRQHDFTVTHAVVKSTNKKLTFRKNTRMSSFEKGCIHILVYGLFCY